MNAHLLTGVAAGLGVLTLPGTVELAALTVAGLLPRRARTKVGDVRRIKKLAVVVPAHDEATLIGRCLRSIATCVRPDSAETAVVVVADNCTDATACIASDAGARVLVRSDPAQRGKGFALQFAFQRLLEERYDAVLVIDADSIVEPNLLVEAIELFNKGADGVQTRYTVLNCDASTRTRLLNIALMAVNVLRARGRSRMGLSVGIFGNGFGLSKETLETIPYDTHSVVEDLEYHLRVVYAGRKIAFANGTCVRSDMPTGGPGTSTQRARWEGGRLGVALQELPGLARGLAGGSRQLLEPLLDLGTLPLAFHVLLLGMLVLVPYPIARAYALGALLVVAVHVAGGIVVGGGDWRDLLALMRVPFYIIWKLTVVPSILQSARKRSPWIRTRRQ